MPTTLSGQIERITFTNEENGFTIARVKVDGHHEPVTVVGILMAPMPGEILDMRGEWSNHPRFGRQFKVLEYRTKVPATVYGIRKYLGNGKAVFFIGEGDSFNLTGEFCRHWLYQKTADRRQWTD